MLNVNKHENMILDISIVDVLMENMMCKDKKIISIYTGMDKSHSKCVETQNARMGQCLHMSVTVILQTH